MKISTRSLGEIEVKKSDIFTFVEPILGFAEYSEFALIEHASVGKHIRILQSLKEYDLSFVLIDPDVVNTPFSPKISQQTVDLLKANNKDISAFFIAVIPSDFKEATVNMKSPLLFCEDTGLALQVVLEEDYPIRCNLFDKKGDC